MSKITPDSVPVATFLEMLDAEERELTDLGNVYRAALMSRARALKDGGHLAAAFIHLRAYLAETRD